MVPGAGADRAALGAGPYVDFICTRQYTFTLAAPIRCAGRFIGVAGADILAAQVERLVLPGLAGLGCTAVLASAHGRVIASTSASLPPGVALPRRPEAAGFVPLAGSGSSAAGGPGADARPAAVDAARPSHWMIIHGPRDPRPAV